MRNNNAEALEYDALFKVLLIGDSGVGKSSIIRRLADDDFEEDQPCTIGVDFKSKIINVEDKKINLTIWDTAGQEKFRSLTSSYYRGTNGIMLVYDVGERKTFQSLESWLNEVNLYTDFNSPSRPITLLIGNKVDKQTRAVSTEEGRAFAKSHNIDAFIECSAKTSLGIRQAFDELVQKILMKPSLWQEKKDNRINVTGTGEEAQYGCGLAYCSVG